MTTVGRALAAATMMTVVASTAGGLGAQAPTATPPRPTLAIERVTALPMDRDTALAEHTVLLAGDRIAWVGPSRQARVPAGVPRVDGGGRFLIPGLADMHVHLRLADLPAYVAAGVTTVVNMNGQPEHLEWRDRVARGTLLGPRVFTAGPAISRRNLGLSGVGPRSEAEADAFARAQRRAGYDFIKVQTGISLPVYRRLLQAARAERMAVVGHVAPKVGSANAIAAGQVSFEHAELTLFGGDERRIETGARALARAGASVGTIVSARDGTCTPPTDVQRRIVTALRRAGVRLLAGSDASLGPLRPGGALHCELLTLVRAGLTPYEALRAATRDAGEFARLHLGERVPFGVVTAGARADLVLLAADPRRDLSTIARPIGTVLRGAWRPAP